MHDPMTQICSNKIFTLWHVDPCKRGFGDDSCGWFKRATHGDKKVLEKIQKRFEFDWDRVFKSDSGNVYYCGLFYPEDSGAGMPNLTVNSIAINLFFLAALEHFSAINEKTARKKASEFCHRNLFEILLFAENPFDSMRDSLIQKFGTARNREERINQIAAMVYGWILRAETKWWQHPRWHIHHWSFQFHLWQRFRRNFITRCCKCGKRFNKTECAIGSWDAIKSSWWRGEKGLFHDRCDESKAQT